MKKSVNKFLTIVLAVLLMPSATKAQNDDGIKLDYATNVGDFTELIVNDGINVIYVESNDSVGIVTFSTSNKEVVDNITFKNNKKGKLTVVLDPRDAGVTSVIPTVTVRSKFLQAVTNQGDSSVRILTMRSVPIFKVRLNGNGFISVRDIDVSTLDASIKFGHGNITLRGKAENVNLNNTGAGTIQAGNLSAKEVKCTVIGSGSVDCTVSETLVVMGAGSGKVYYNGQPSNLRNRAAGIKAFNINE